MRIRSFITVGIIAGSLFAFTPDNDTSKDQTGSIRELKQSSFKKGEFLQYDVSYGFFDAAKATLEVASNSKEINGRNTMHIVGKGRSTGALRWFFKVDDKYETYIDEEAILPWKFVRHVREGGYSLDRSIDFDQFENKVTVFQKDTKDYTVKGELRLCKVKESSVSGELANDEIEATKASVKSSVSKQSSRVCLRKQKFQHATKLEHLEQKVSFLLFFFKFSFF